MSGLNPSSFLENVRITGDNPYRGKHSIGPSAPSGATGEPRAVGDIHWHTDPTALEPVGWVCTTAGDPGTWTAFGGNGQPVSATVLSATTQFNLAGIETGLTAHAGGTQAAALALSATKSVHNVGTVGSANDSVILPAATGSGQLHLVKNSAAANSLQLFAALTETIDGVASATGVAVAAGKSRIVVDIAAATWVSLLGA